MEIIIKEENGKLFGSTKIVGIGKRQPKLIYGKQAKKLREKSLLSIDGLAKEFEVKPNIIQKLEEQKISLNDKLFEKYKNKFGIDKEYFFDLDLETLILSGEGHIIKTFDSSEECKKAYDEIMEDYFNAIENKEKYIIVDFNKKEGI